MNLLGAILTLCALRYIRRSTVRWIVAVGAVFGLLVTTKLSVLPLGLLLPVLALSTPTAWFRRLYLLSYAVVAALVVSSWYLIQNWVRYGDLLAGHVSDRYEQIIGGLGTSFWAPYVVTDPLRLVFFDVPKRLITSYWFESGWMRYHWSTWIGILMTLVVVAVAVGLIGQHLPNRELLARDDLNAFAHQRVVCRLPDCDLPVSARIRWPSGDRSAVVLGLTAMASPAALVASTGGPHGMLGVYSPLRT